MVYRPGRRMSKYLISLMLYNIRQNNLIVNIRNTILLVITYHYYAHLKYDFEMKIISPEASFSIQFLQKLFTDNSEIS